MLFSGVLLFAQTNLTGKVTDKQTGESLPGASITIVGKNLGTTTDFDGNYKLTVSLNTPFTLEVSSVGFESITIEVTKSDQTLNFKLEEAAEALDEVVVSASRTPERIRESPVTIERMDARAIQATSSPNFYDGLENLKGVDINTNSLTFKSVNTRGFATFSNARFVQLVDGVDNSSPALNFVLGNLIGMNELDVNTVEILPGASSALYGANAFNGILFMTSKDPFRHTGISTYYKTGLTMQEVAGDNRFNDVGIRAAYKFSDKFAAKANFSYLRGTDWWATNYDQYSDAGIPAGEPNTITKFEDADPGHDALNRYGDEVAVRLDYDKITGAPIGTFGAQKVARTGYNEVDLMDYDARSVRADFALHYKPWANDKEVIFNYRVGRGNTIYQGANRYSIKDFVMEQMKLEFKGKNFFLRGYRTSETAGDSYDSRFTAINMNRTWKSDRAWFTDYAGGYLGMFTGAGMVDPNFAALATALGFAPGNIDQANAMARILADNRLPDGNPVNPTVGGYMAPGSDAFKTVFNQVITDPDLATGSKFQDESKVHHLDANYNFSELLNNWGNVQIGGSYREYSLNSHGTIFTDYDGPITYDELGAYVQVSKKFADDRLKFTGSARYDKAQNFEGHLSPRLALVYSGGENKNHNFRASYQTGFRNPTTQDQYIGLNAGLAILVGSAPDNLDRYTASVDLNPLGNGGLFTGGATAVEVVGRQAYENAFTRSSLEDFGAAVQADTQKFMTDFGMPEANAKQLAVLSNTTILEETAGELVKPERISAYELGYRGKLGVFNIDLNGYFNQYEDFIATTTVIAPLYGNIAASNLNETFVDFSSGVPTVIAAPNLDTQMLLSGIGDGDFQPFQIYTNSKADISSYGATLGLSTKINKFKLGLNYTYAQFIFDQTTDPDYEAGFNTPEHKVKASLGTDNLFKNFGFNINYRYSTEFLWQSSMVDALVPARSVVDAQISYRVPSFKSLFKVGGANIAGKDYVSAPGSGYIGSQYFVSWTINP